MLEVAEKSVVKKNPTRHLPPNTVASTAFVYFVCSLAIVAGLALLLDRWIIPAMENSGQLESYLWNDENHRINHFVYLRNQARKDNPVWRSPLLPVAEAHPGKKRILVMGDSFVWGDGYSNINTLWWRQLGQELKARGYNDVEVISAGLCGASTHDQLDWVKALIPKYTPDLVVFGYVTNDPDEASSNGKSIVKMLPKELVDDSKLIATLQPLLPNLAGQLRQIRKMANQAHMQTKSAAFEYSDWELQLLQGDNFKAYSHTVEELGSYLKDAKTPGFVIGLPAGFQNKTKENSAGSHDFFERVKNYNEERYAPVKPIFAKAGLRFVDTASQFVEAAKKDPQLKGSTSPLRLGINPGNGHPGPFSTHFYATSAADVIEQSYPSALGAKSEPKQSVTAPVIVNDCVPPYMNVSHASADTVKFTYPPDVTEHTLFLPLRRKHVQLSFAQPTSVKSIELTGKCLASAQIYLVYVDPKKGYEIEELTSLPKQTGKDLKFAIPQSDKLLCSVRLRAGFNGGDQNLEMKFAQ